MPMPRSRLRSYVLDDALPKRTLPASRAYRELAHYLETLPDGEMRARAMHFLLVSLHHARLAAMGEELRDAAE